MTSIHAWLRFRDDFVSLRSLFLMYMCVILSSVSSEMDIKMEIILVWNNARSFQKHIEDMKQFSREHKNIPPNEIYMTKNMPLPGNFGPTNARGGQKILISSKRKNTLVPLWAVELPKGVQN